MMKIRTNQGSQLKNLSGRLLLLFLWSFFLAPSAIHADAAVPRYAVSFPYKDGIRIGELSSGGDWQIDPVPDAFYGDSMDQVVRPIWSPDGHTLYYNALTPDGSGNYHDVRAYDLLKHTSTLIVSLPTEQNSETDPLKFDISPDNRYLWVTHSPEFPPKGSALVDLRAPAKQRIILQYECDTDIMAWLPHRLVVQSINACDPFNVLDINLDTGKILHQTPIMDEQSDKDRPGFEGFLSVAWILIPGQESYFLGEQFNIDDASTHISRFEPETGTISKIADGSNLMVSDDKSSAIFLQEDQYVWLDTASLKTKSIASTDSMSGITSRFQFNNTFHFIAFSPEENPSQIDEIVVSKAGITRKTWYKGTPVEAACVELSSTLEFIMLVSDCQDKQSTLTIYDANGKEVWSNTKEAADIQQAFTQSAYPQTAINGNGWSEVGDWYHFWLITDLDSTGDYTPGKDRPARSDYAVNARTGETLRAPHPGSQYWESSPDGAWWLYAVLDKQDPAKDSFEAYNPVTGKTFVLSSGALLPIYNYNYQFPIFTTWTTIK